MNKSPIEKQPQDVVEQVAMALAAHAWEFGWADTIQEDVGLYVAEHWREYEGKAKAAIAAMPNQKFGEADKADAVSALYRPILRALEGVASGKVLDAGVVAANALDALLDAFEIRRGG